MNWSPKHDFKLIARSFERTNFHFSKNSLIRMRLIHSFSLHNSTIRLTYPALLTMISMRPNLSIAFAKMAFTSSTFETSSPTTRARFKVSTSYLPLSSAWRGSGLRVVAMTDCPVFRSSCSRAFPSPEEVPVTVQ